MKINTGNHEAVNTAIKNVEGKATARLATAEDVATSVERIEARLIEMGVPKNLWQGLVVFCDPNAQDFPRAYKYCPDSTQYTLARGASGWFVTDIARDYCQRGGHDCSWRNFDQIQAAVIEAARKDF